jgi:hypothetical protein
VTTPLDHAIRISLGRVPFRFHGSVIG